MMKNLDQYRAVLFGGIIAAILLSMFYVFNEDDTKPQTPQSNFEVVDTYKNCDLVRWTNRQLSDYKYVLYCPQK